jgi:hypothetical protein
MSKIQPITNPLNSKSSVIEALRSILLASSEWRSSVELKQMLRERGIYCTDSSVTGRIRDLRTERYGGLKIECRPFRKGVYGYRVVK